MNNLILRRAMCSAYALIVSGCTSLQLSDYQQAVRVTSKIEGAEIRYDGEMMGTTPALIHVRRGESPDLALNFPGQPGRVFELDGKYRFWESFVPPLFAGAFAPVFIALDLATRTAWDLPDLIDADVPGTPPAKREQKVWNVAIAPPQAAGQGESDQIGEHLEKFFSGRTNWKVIPFKDTLPRFEDTQYTNTNVIEGRLRNEVFAHMGVTHVVESTFDPKTGKINYTVKDVLREKDVDSGSLPAPAINKDKWRLAKHFISGLIPNTIALDLSNSWIQINYEGQDEAFGSEAEPVAGWMGELSRFIGTVGLSNLVPPRAKRAFVPKARLVSNFSVSLDEFTFPTTVLNFADTKFRRTRIMAAAGPEGYLETALGIFYAHFMLGYGYSEIEWDSPNQSGELGRGNVNGIMGVGYYAYLADRVSLRIFMRSVTEDTRNWDLALDRSQGVDFPTSGVSMVTAGLSVGFYFPEPGRWMRH